MMTSDRGAHDDLADQGRQGHHGHHGHHGAAPGERDVAQGTIAPISGTTFVLTTAEGTLTVTAGADTTCHGLPGRVAREAGHQKLTFAALRGGQRVGVMGERLDDATLLAKRVHLSEL
jgi:hypothetical protein